MSTPVFVTTHALYYIGGHPMARTRLQREEVEELVSNGAYVRIGFSKYGACYDLVWDHREKKGLVLLTSKGEVSDEIAIISVWETSFKPTNTLVKKAYLKAAREKAEELWSRTQE